MFCLFKGSKKARNYEEQSIQHDSSSDESSDHDSANHNMEEQPTTSGLSGIIILIDMSFWFILIFLIWRIYFYRTSLALLPIKQ